MKACAAIFGLGLAYATITGTAIAEDLPQERPDLMTFAQGVLPISIETGAEDLRTQMQEAVALIDGNASNYILTPRPGSAEASVTLVFALPALTRFDRLAVPEIHETPSPSQTFVKTVRVSGSSTGPDGPFEPLAEAELTTHAGPGEVTELALADPQPEVKWVKIELAGGIEILNDKTFFEFSEIIGNGTQAAAPLSDRFDGIWRARGVDIELTQSGAAVTGCYDTKDPLTGDVEGNLLRASGTDAAGVISQFILNVADDGSMRGLRSTNGAPFRLYEADASKAKSKCQKPEPAKIGCGSVLHGIGFDYDSAAIREQSKPLLEALYDGLAGDSAASIEIRGHSSSEGADSYNLDLSQRRAQSVVDALAALGLEGRALSAVGRGETEPIASNDDEAGRSLNRRVEIVCQG